MAEQDVLVATAHLADHEKKRKLEDLETDAPEPSPSGVDSLSKTDGDAGEDGTSDGKEEEGDGSELKRHRLEVHHVDAQANGYSELEKPEEENVGEKLATISGNINLEVGNGQEQAPVTVGGLADSCQPSEGIENPSTLNEKPNTDNCDEKEESRGQIEPASEGNESGDQHESRGPDSETTTRKIDVPNNKVGVLIGKAGDTIRFLQYNSGAKIQIMRDADADPRAATRPVELIGTVESINRAEKLINDVITEADAGGSPSLVARGFSTVQTVIGDQVEIQVPNEKVGLIIGKGGETIKNLQTSSGARIQLVPQHLPAGDQSKERTVRVTGDRKQIEIAREMIKEVMNQPVRPSPLSGVGYHQPAFRARGPVPSQWGNRGHPGQYMGYDYQQRGPYPSQNPQFPVSQYGNYYQQAPRSSYGPSWGQRPPAALHGQPPQASYNYGQPHGPEYGQPTPYSHAPAQSYGPGYTEMKYESQMPSQHSYGGPGVPQSTGYPQGTAAHLGYGPQGQYGRQGSYGMPPQGPHGQTYGQPRASQPGEMPYAAPASAQPYGSNVPPQQNYGYTSSGPVQQSYPPYGSGPANDGYSHPNATAAAPVYPQAGGQPVSSYGQPAGQQTSAYGSYPTQAGYAEQPAAAANTGYGYQASGEAAYPGSGTYGAQAAGQQGYAQQPPPSQPGYDQTNPQTGAYGSAPAPQPGYPPQYDSSQVYAEAPR